MTFETFKVRFPRGRYGFLNNIQEGEIRSIPSGYDFKMLRIRCLRYMREHKIVLSWEKQEDGGYKIKREA